MSTLFNFFPEARISPALAAMRPGLRPAPRASVSRKSVTDKLGLPATATDAETLAAIDAKLAANAQRTTADPEGSLFARVYGASPARNVELAHAIASTEDKIFDSVFPAQKNEA